MNLVFRSLLIRKVKSLLNKWNNNHCKVSLEFLLIYNNNKCKVIKDMEVKEETGIIL